MNGGLLYNMQTSALSHAVLIAWHSHEFHFIRKQSVIQLYCLTIIQDKAKVELAWNYLKYLFSLHLNAEFYFCACRALDRIFILINSSYERDILVNKHFLWIIKLKNEVEVLNNTRIEENLWIYYKFSRFLSTGWQEKGNIHSITR